MFYERWTTSPTLAHHITNPQPVSLHAFVPRPINRHLENFVFISTLQELVFGDDALQFIAAKLVE